MSHSANTALRAYRFANGQDHSSFAALPQAIALPLVAAILWYFGRRFDKVWAGMDYHDRKAWREMVEQFRSLGKTEPPVKLKPGFWLRNFPSYLLVRSIAGITKRAVALINQDDASAMESWNRAVRINPRLAESVTVDTANYELSMTVPGRLEGVGPRTEHDS